MNIELKHGSKLLASYDTDGAPRVGDAVNLNYGDRAERVRVLGVCTHLEQRDGLHFDHVAVVVSVEPDVSYKTPAPEKPKKSKEDT